MNPVCLSHHKEYKTKVSSFNLLHILAKYQVFISTIFQIWKFRFDEVIHVESSLIHKPPPATPPYQIFWMSVRVGVSVRACVPPTTHPPLRACFNIL